MPRPSPIRDAIVTLLQAHPGRPWSADDALQGLQERGVPADYSSVWRALVYLEEIGTAQRCDLGDGKARYEIGEGHHEHVRCLDCGKVARVPGCSVERTQQRAAAATGYVITGHQVVFSGLCRGCAAQQSH